VGAAAIKVALLAAALMFVATTSQADPGGGRGHGRGGQSRGGGERQYKGGGRSQGGSDRTYGGSERRYKGGGSQGGNDRQYGGNGRQYGGNDRQYGGSERRYKGGGSQGSQGGRAYGGNWSNGGGRTYVDRGVRTYGGGYRYGGSVPYYGGSGSSYCAPYGSSVVRYVRPYRYGYVRPRSYVSLGIGIGVPYYCPPTYRTYVAPPPVIEESSDQIDVENLPPAGCYYYDPFCEREFSDLDSYTDHIDQTDHAKTIEIINRDSGDRLRTLEFVGGYWSVQP
jgi:hypothetical protein